ncbi:MAG: acyl-CoA dehydrogenase family protein [Acidimicrobiales bacterium]
MRFAFDEHQIEFRDTVRQVLAKECTTADLRAAYANPVAKTERWAILASIGVAGLTVPDLQGGLGLGLVDLVALLEESGAVGLPEPLVETTALAVPLLADLLTDRAHDAQLASWLRSMGDGSITAALGLATDSSVPVAAADGADLFVLAAEGTEGLELHVVDADAVSVTPVVSLDPTRRLGVPSFEPSPSTRFAAGSRARSLAVATAERGAVATAAVLLGLSEKMIGLGAAYAQERRQFGHAIGSFQAVKHLLAGAQVKLEFARPLVYAAAWSLDADTPGRSRAASAAKASASEAATEAARVALQVHGAIGYTWECDLHLFMKRAWALAEAWGSAAQHRRQVLDSLVRER